jgi:tetratricopeptide (TPR) repeat protein
LEAEVPENLAGNEEVETALVLRATKVDDFERAVMHGRKATAAVRDLPNAFVLLGVALIRTGLAGPTQAYGDAPRIRDRARIEEAIEAFNKATALPPNRQVLDLRVQALMGRALASCALGRDREAEVDYNEARALMPEHPGVLTRVAMHQHGLKRYGDAIANLREAISRGGGTDAEFLLSLALYSQNEGPDRRDAVGLVSQISSRSDSVHCRNALHMTIEWLLELGRSQDAEDYVTAEVHGQQAGPMVTALLRAKILMARGDRDGASSSTEEALSHSNSDLPWEDRRELAILLGQLGRFGDALAIWRQTVRAAEGDPDTRNLVECAIKAGEYGAALEACAAFRATGFLDPYLLHRELDLLDDYDPDEAVRLLQSYVSMHPLDRLSRLRLSLLGLALDRKELVTSALADLPPVEVVGAINGRAAVTVLLRSGRPNDAIKYAYNLLRANFEDPIAHFAYISVMHGWNGAKPEIHALECAGIGAAVQYVEEGEADHWAVLEDSSAPSLALSEYGPDHQLALGLNGKRVGEQFVLVHGRFRNRMATVKQILSKYVFRLQDSIERWPVLFPEFPWVEVFRNRTKAGNGKGQPEIADFLAAVDDRHRRIQESEGNYQSQAIPVHFFAGQAGANPIEALFHLAAKPGLSIRCFGGSHEEWSRALADLGSSERVVVELTALSTLLLLGIEESLRGRSAPFVVSRGTVQELRALIERRRLGVPRGRLFKNENRYVFAEQDSDGWWMEQVRLEALAKLLESSCEVRGCRELASLGSDHRRNLIEAFGLHGAQSIILAANPGHVLWTDDIMLAACAKGDFGVRRIWTQLVLEADVEAGTLAEPTYWDALFKLVTSGYTGLFERIFSRAGSLADWDADRWPLEPALNHIANESLDLQNRVRLAVRALVDLLPCTVLPERRQRIVIRIAERLSSGTGSRDLVLSVARQLPRVFEQDSFHALEAQDILYCWLAGSAKRIILPAPSIIQVRAPSIILPGSTNV